MKCIYILLFLCNMIYSFSNNSQFLIQSHLQSLMQFKIQTQNFLKNIFTITGLNSESSSNSFLKNNNQYKFYSYDEIFNLIYKLSKEHPDYVKVTTAQDLYNLPNPMGSCGIKYDYYLC